MFIYIEGGAFHFHQMRKGLAPKVISMEVMQSSRLFQTQKLSSQA